MIKIFITVGTTPFDQLIKFCDMNIDLNRYEVLAQISNASTYETTNIESIKFSNNIMELYNNADVVITHAGAGSVYNLLELNKKIILVPNFTMKDHHQNDISKYVSSNLYAKVLNLNEVVNINQIVEDTYKANFKIYTNESKKNLAQSIYEIIK